MQCFSNFGAHENHLENNYNVDSWALPTLRDSDSKSCIGIRVLHFLKDIFY